MPQFRRPITLDMTPDGRFAGPASGGPSWPVKLGAVATIVAASIGALVVGALVLWLALWLVAFAAVAGLVAWAAFRIQMWRMRNRTQGAPPAPWMRR
jgi:hypothetical protein